jgi:hypothetical protein
MMGKGSLKSHTPGHHFSIDKGESKKDVSFDQEEIADSCVLQNLRIHGGWGQRMGAACLVEGLETALLPWPTH